MTNIKLASNDSKTIIIIIFHIFKKLSRDMEDMGGKGNKKATTEKIFHPSTNEKVRLAILVLDNVGFRVKNTLPGVRKMTS